jgi:hypothetical protein
MMTSSIKMEELLALAAEDLAVYTVANWPGFELAKHHQIVVEKLKAVERGEIDRLMIFLPPRVGKSMIASQYFPAWYLGRHSDPAELQRRETRLKRIRAAKRALEERARQLAEKAGKPREEVQQAKPADKDQYNFTDPQSRLMKGSDGLVQEVWCKATTRRRQWRRGCS